MHQWASISVDRQQTVEEAFERILRTNLGAIERWEPVAVAGKDIEGVHEVRVGLRRMRSTLTVFALAIPREFTRSQAKELRRVGKALDRARDLDVYISETLSAAPKKAGRRLRKISIKHREEAYVDLRELLQSKRYRHFKNRFTRWLDTREWRGAMSAEQSAGLRRKVTPFASRVLEQHRAQVLEDGMEIERLDSDELHHLRINCKKLRYATEFFAPLYDGEMREFSKHLKALQDFLGTLHDTTVMTGLHHDLLKDTGKSKLRRMARELEEERKQESEKIMRTFVRRWETFCQVEGPWVTSRIATPGPNRLASSAHDAVRMASVHETRPTSTTCSVQGGP